MAERCLRGQGRPVRPVRLHARQERRRLLTDNPLPGLRISRSLVHWESQSVTREDSETGLRYRNHEREGRSIMLFTRLRQSDRAFWFLGPARYVRHVGERPMAITWELEHPLPGDLFATFAAAV